MDVLFLVSMGFSLAAIFFFRKCLLLENMVLVSFRIIQSNSPSVLTGWFRDLNADVFYCRSWMRRGQESAPLWRKWTAAYSRTTTPSWQMPSVKWGLTMRSRSPYSERNTWPCMKPRLVGPEPRLSVPQLWLRFCFGSWGLYNLPC